MVKKIVQNRNEPFAKGIKTAIWREIAAPNNPYLTADIECCGYSRQQLLEQCSLIEMLFLSLTGELPSPEQCQLFEALWQACFNLGPRHAAVRAVFNAGASKTKVEHLLPVGLMLAGGAEDGAVAVTTAMTFLLKFQPLEQVTDDDLLGFTGLGSRFGNADPIALANLAYLSRKAPWAGQLKQLAGLQQRVGSDHLGVLMPGVVAAALLDLGFQPRQAAGMSQLLYMPGLLAHAFEASQQQITDLPFIPDEDYQIDFSI